MTTLTTDSASPSFSLNTLDWKSIGFGALDAAGGALLTYGTTIITGINFGGTATPIIMFIWTAFTKAARKYLSNGDASGLKN